MGGGFGAGMAMSEHGQLPVQQAVELLAVRLAGDSQVVLERKVIRLWVEAWLHLCWPGRPSGGG